MVSIVWASICMASIVLVWCTAVKNTRTKRDMALARTHCAGEGSHWGGSVCRRDRSRSRSRRSRRSRSSRRDRSRSRKGPDRSVVGLTKINNIRCLRCPDNIISGPYFH